MQKYFLSPTNCQLTMVIINYLWIFEDSCFSADFNISSSCMWKKGSLNLNSLYACLFHFKRGSRCTDDISLPPAEWSVKVWAAAVAGSWGRILPGCRGWHCRSGVTSAALQHQQLFTMGAPVPFPLLMTAAIWETLIATKTHSISHSNLTVNTWD